MELSDDVLSYVTDGGEERFRDNEGLPFSPFEALAACVEPIAELEADLKERRAMCKKYSKYVLMRDELVKRNQIEMRILWDILKQDEDLEKQALVLVMVAAPPQEEPPPLPDPPEPSSI